MENFLLASFAFPTVIFSFLLCVAVLYWCVAALGILEVDEVLDLSEVGTALRQWATSSKAARAVVAPS